MISFTNIKDYPYFPLPINILEELLPTKTVCKKITETRKEKTQSEDHGTSRSNSSSWPTNGDNSGHSPDQREEYI